MHHPVIFFTHLQLVFSYVISQLYFNSIIDETAATTREAANNLNLWLKHTHDFMITRFYRRHNLNIFVEIFRTNFFLYRNFIGPKLRINYGITNITKYCLGLQIPKERNKYLLSPFIFNQNVICCWKMLCQKLCDKINSLILLGARKFDTKYFLIRNFEGIFVLED